MASREHVISKEDDLDAFFRSHPLHPFYSGERAYLVRHYRAAIENAGLNMKRLLGPFESVLNYFPMTRTRLQEKLAESLGKILGKPLAGRVACLKGVQAFAGRCYSILDQTPGRLYSFMAVKEG